MRLTQKLLAKQISDLTTDEFNLVIDFITRTYNILINEVDEIIGYLENVCSYDTVRDSLRVIKQKEQKQCN